VKLIEILVASAVAFILTWLLVRLAGQTIFAAAHLDARLTGRSTTDRLAERLESDAAGAWSIFIPAKDVFGAENADAHELDFTSQDASHHTYWWAYGYAPGGSMPNRILYVICIVLFGIARFPYGVLSDYPNYHHPRPN
jgi:hypothetical protein